MNEQLSTNGAEHSTNEQMHTNCAENGFGGGGYGDVDSSAWLVACGRRIEIAGADRGDVGRVRLARARTVSATFFVGTVSQSIVVAMARRDCDRCWSCLRELLTSIAEATCRRNLGFESLGSLIWEGLVDYIVGWRFAFAESLSEQMFLREHRLGVAAGSGGTLCDDVLGELAGRRSRSRRRLRSHPPRPHGQVADMLRWYDRWPQRHRHRHCRKCPAVGP